jgi:predicted transcriptional regulator
MTPLDVRNETWESVQDRLQGDREKVYFALLDAGPQTTRALAVTMNWERDNVRPRVTELLQCVFVECVGKDTDGAGIYKAIPFSQAKVAFEERKAAGDQMLLRV